MNHGPVGREGPPASPTVQSSGATHPRPQCCCLCSSCAVAGGGGGGGSWGGGGMGGVGGGEKNTGGGAAHACTVVRDHCGYRGAPTSTRQLYLSALSHPDIPTAL